MQKDPWSLYQFFFPIVTSCKVQFYIQDIDIDTIPFIFSCSHVFIVCAVDSVLYNSITGALEHPVTTQRGPFGPGPGPLLLQEHRTPPSTFSSIPHLWPSLICSLLLKLHLFKKMLFKWNHKICF